MQRSVLGVFVLLLLVAGASVAAIWYLRGGGVELRPDATGPDATVMARPEAGEVAAAEGAVDTEAAAEQRQAVAAGDTGDASGPAIVGRVVGEDKQPIEGAEVQCRPGANFLDMENFDLFDGEAADMGDMETWAERFREQARLRTVVRTDADGRFAVRARGEGRAVSLRVSAPGLRVLERNAVRPTASETDLGELVLQTGAIVSGRVVDAHGNPVEGARVRRMQEFEMTVGMDLDFAVPGAEVFESTRGGDSAVTDAAGRFELAHCEAGEFALQARHPDRPSARSDKLTVAKGQTLHGVVVAMQAGATITGVVRGVPEGVKNVRVMASARRAPAAGGEGAATVFNLIGDPGELLGDMGMPFGERHATLGNDGTFEFRGLQMGTTYNVWAVQQGRGFRGGACTQRLEVASGTSGVELRYEAGVNVTFTVLAAGTGQPVEQLWVRDRLRGGENAGIEFGDFTWGGGSGGRSAKYPDGKVTIANLRPKKDQTLQLNLEAVGFESFERKDIVLPTSGTLDLGTVRLQGHPVVVVTVLDSDGGRPIAKARVSLQEQAQGEDNPFGRIGRRMGGGGPASAQTDEEGRCTVNAPAGAAKLEVTARGFAPGAAELSASTEAVREQTVRLSVGGTVEVTVRAAGGEPLAGASVEGRDADGERSRQRTDAKGIARFTHQTPGRHEFRLAEQRGDVAWVREAISVRVNGGQPPADDTTWTAVDVVDRATATLTLEKAAAARLRGVVRENGVPLAGASVAFREGAQAGGAGSDVEAMMGGMLERMGQRGRSQARTGDDGSFELADLPAGAHHLRITHKDRAMSTDVAVTLAIGDNRSDVELDMTALRGVVLDPDGRPVDGARVRVAVARERSGPDVAGMVEGMLPGMNLGGTSQRTDGNGEFELRGVQPGVALTVSASARGFAPASVSATATLGQTTAGVKVQLLAAGKVEVSVAGAGAFAAVQARFVGDDETAPPVMQMLRRGKGTLTGLRPGTWEIEFQGMPNGERGEPRKKTVEVRAGETVTVEF